MKISNFVSNLTSGMARTNRFSVVMDVPVSLEGITPFKNLLVFCDQAQLPGLSINTQPIRVFGEVRETPYEFNYEPIQFSFYVDGDMHVKAYFDEWINSIQNGNRRTYKYYNTYVCPQFQVLVQDVSDNTVFQVTLFEAYPKSVSAIQMDYASKDIMKIQVSMVYKYWKSTPVNSLHQYWGTDVYTNKVANNNGQVVQGGSLQPQPQTVLSGVDLLNGGAATQARNIVGGTISSVEQDIYKTIAVPQEYFSNFNQFQQNLAGNITSNINGITSGLANGIQGARNEIMKSASQGLDSGVAEVKSWFV